jgi:PhnB protein
VQVSPYLNFNGNCAEAFRLYEKVLGGRIEALMTHGESPIADQVPPHWSNRVLHARLAVGDTILMASEAHPSTTPSPAASMSLSRSKTRWRPTASSTRWRTRAQ